MDACATRCALLRRALGRVALGLLGTLPAVAGATPLALPASFGGELRCPGCERAQLRLDLRRDGMFLWRSRAQARGGIGEVQRELGRWRYRPDTRELRLSAAGGASKCFEVLSAREIALRGADCATRATQARLHRLARPEPFVDPLRVSGMYFLHGAGAVLVECSTGIRFALAGGPAAAALERARLEAGRSDAQGLYVSVLARLTAAGEGDTLEPLRMLRAAPTERCALVP